MPPVRGQGKNHLHEAGSVPQQVQPNAPEAKGWSSMKHKLYDTLGQKITPGCTVVYPVFTRGSIVMRKMQVVEVRDKIVGYRNDGRRVVVKHVHNCVVVHS